MGSPAAFARRLVDFARSPSKRYPMALALLWTKLHEGLPS
jgi:hypothetical protein